MTALEVQLEKQNTSILEVICKNGFIDILEYYLPHYLQSYDPAYVVKIDEAYTIDFEKSKYVDTRNKNTYTPIQVACEKGNMGIINLAYNYFKCSDCPYQLDIDFQDESTGENCALIACRRGNFAMIKFLHEHCNANFRVINKRNEGALQIVAAGSKKKPLVGYHDCFVYLIEKVGLDITYNYEETLLLTDNRPIIKFIECQLFIRGIRTSKMDIENRQAIIPTETGVRDLESYDLDLKRCLEKNDDLKSLPSSVDSYESNSPFISF